MRTDEDLRSYLSDVMEFFGEMLQTFQTLIAPLGFSIKACESFDAFKQSACAAGKSREEYLNNLCDFKNNYVLAVKNQLKLLINPHALAIDAGLLRKLHMDSIDSRASMTVDIFLQNFYDVLTTQFMTRSAAETAYSRTSFRFR